VKVRLIFRETDGNIDDSIMKRIESASELGKNDITLPGEKRRTTQRNGKKKYAVPVSPKKRGTYSRTIPAHRNGANAVAKVNQFRLGLLEADRLISAVIAEVTKSSSVL